MRVREAKRFAPGDTASQEGSDPELLSLKPKLFPLHTLVIPAWGLPQGLRTIAISLSKVIAEEKAADP